MKYKSRHYSKALEILGVLMESVGNRKYSVSESFLEETCGKDWPVVRSLLEEFELCWPDRPGKFEINEMHDLEHSEGIILLCQDNARQDERDRKRHMFLSWSAFWISIIAIVISAVALFQNQTH